MNGLSTWAERMTSHDDAHETLGNRIKAARLEQGRTQLDVAESACVTTRTLIKLENGGNVTMHTLSAVANALGGRLVWRSHHD